MWSTPDLKGFFFCEYIELINVAAWKCELLFVLTVCYWAFLCFEISSHNV
jgi:hypothetical protein